MTRTVLNKMLGFIPGIGQLLGLDFIGTEVKYDVVTYKWIGLGILKNQRVAKVKAKIFQVFDFPVDIPIDVRIIPTKQGLVTKEYLVEVDMPKADYEMK